MTAGAVTAGAVTAGSVAAGAVTAGAGSPSARSGRAPRLDAGPAPGRCARCLLPASHCLCAEIPRIATRTRVLVIRHASERWRTSNTARLAALALPRCEVVDHGLRGAPIDEASLALDGAWLLFPDASAPPPMGSPPDQIVVVDGSWQQARRMVQRIAALRGLPRLSLPPPPAPGRRLRRARRADGVSTLEAIAHALRLLEGPACAEPLERLHERFVLRVLEANGAPAR